MKTARAESRRQPSRVGIWLLAALLGAQAAGDDSAPGHAAVLARLRAEKAILDDLVTRTPQSERADRSRGLLGTFRNRLVRERAGLERPEDKKAWLDLYRQSLQQASRPANEDTASSLALAREVVDSCVWARITGEPVDLRPFAIIAGQTSMVDELVTLLRDRFKEGELRGALGAGDVAVALLERSMREPKTILGQLELIESWAVRDAKLEATVLKVVDELFTQRSPELIANLALMSQVASRAAHLAGNVEPVLSKHLVKVTCEYHGQLNFRDRESLFPRADHLASATALKATKLYLLASEAGDLHLRKMDEISGLLGTTGSYVPIGMYRLDLVTGSEPAVSVLFQVRETQSPLTLVIPAEIPLDSVVVHTSLSGESAPLVYPRTAWSMRELASALERWLESGRRDIGALLKRTSAGERVTNAQTDEQWRDALHALAGSDHTQPLAIPADLARDFHKQFLTEVTHGGDLLPTSRQAQIMWDLRDAAGFDSRELGLVTSDGRFLPQSAAQLSVWIVVPLR